MSIASEIARIIQNIANSYDVCRDNDATMPEVENSDNLAACINTMAGKGILEDIVARILDGENPIDLTELNEVEQYIASLIPRAISISKTITENGVYVAEDDGADGYGMVTVDVDTVNNDSLVVNPSTTTQTFSPSGEYTGFGDVRVNKVTSSIDLNIKPENIKKGVTILGITGEYEGSMDLETVYPLGSIYLQATPGVCVMNDLMPGSIWVPLTGGSCCLQTAGWDPQTDQLHSVGEVIQPGIPNITGSVELHDSSGSNVVFGDNESFGCFYGNSSTPRVRTIYSKDARDTQSYDYVKFDANRGATRWSEYSAGIYGGSETVQPRAIVINAFKRIK